MRNLAQTVSLGPVLEPVEFQERYNQSLTNPSNLGIIGQLTCSTLVVWAASFGIDEYGREIISDSIVDVQQRTELVRDMLHELLYLVDLHGVLRKPSWDGARLLLLLLPLVQGIGSIIRSLLTPADLFPAHRDPKPCRKTCQFYCLSDCICH